MFHLSCTRRLPSLIGANLVVTAAISRLYADRGLVIPKRHLVENRQIPAGSISWSLTTYIHFVVPFPSTFFIPAIYQASLHPTFGSRFNIFQAISTTRFRRQDTPCSSQSRPLPDSKKTLHASCARLIYLLNPWICFSFLLSPRFYEARYRHVDDLVDQLIPPAGLIDTRLQE